MIKTILRALFLSGGMDIQHSKDLNLVFHDCTLVLHNANKIWHLIYYRFMLHCFLFNFAFEVVSKEIRKSSFCFWSCTDKTKQHVSEGWNHYILAMNFKNMLSPRGSNRRNLVPSNNIGQPKSHLKVVLCHTFVWTFLMHKFIKGNFNLVLTHIATVMQVL